MPAVTSRDGTKIAYDLYGNGPAVIIVNGTMNSRVFGPAPAATQLAAHFTVYDYDRRGRGDSGDTLPYQPHKEIEDIEAIIDHAGGAAMLFGLSAGAALALQAAVQLGPSKITKLAMYEGPYTDDPEILNEWHTYGQALEKCNPAKNREEGVMLFLQLVHAESQAGALRKDISLWKKLLELSPTLAYDYQIIGPTKHIPRDILRRVSAPSLVISGEASGAAVTADTKKIAKLMPHAEYRILPKQSHRVEPEAIAPVLQSFFQTTE